jgi:hypothetical protein
MDITKVLSKEEKRKILNYSTDNLLRYGFQGLICGAVAGYITRSSFVGTLIFSYAVGRSLSVSNAYLNHHLIGKDIGTHTLSLLENDRHL